MKIMQQCGFASASLAGNEEAVALAFNHIAGLQKLRVQVDVVDVYLDDSSTASARRRVVWGWWTCRFCRICCSRHTRRHCSLAGRFLLTAYTIRVAIRD